MNEQISLSFVQFIEWNPTLFFFFYPSSPVADYFNFNIPGIIYLLQRDAHEMAVRTSQCHHQE